MTGEEWLGEYCEANNIDWTKLSKPELSHLSRIIPCTLRCWRVGVPIPVANGEKCPECSRVHVEPGKVMSLRATRLLSPLI